ncbi:MAG: molybdopterin biosynthesis protein [Bacillota bacterium]|jgi:putative molybdopterin biosynthesis protein
MHYQYLTNKPLDAAINDYLECLMAGGMSYKKEYITVGASLGRITATAIYAKICSPHYNAAAMDGIALKAQITFGATETTPVILTTDDFIVVDTGDPIPHDCDAVIMIEDVVYDDNGQIKIYKAASPWQHMRQIGEDISAGDMILPSLTPITPAAMGAMLAAGISGIEVVKKPLVGIIPTGDEIIAPCANPAPGDIMEFNSTIFGAMLQEWGAESKTYPIIKDRLDLIKEALQKASDECDLVIINAGSSAGREDFTAQAISEIGEVCLHGIAIKPGKPAILGRIRFKPVIGVPGYPVSGIIVLQQILKPVLDRLCGYIPSHNSQLKAVTGKKINSSLKYREFVRTLVGYVDNNFIAVPLNRGAGVVTSFIKADGIIDIPQDCEGYEIGDTVQVQLLRPLEDIKKTLCVIGSHDPLIDEIADIMRQKSPLNMVNSSHVGSMGAIMSIKRGQAHLGGIHLLDEESGQYNIPYIKRYFPQGGVIVIEGVQRQQGFMVAAGNPKGIENWSDIVEKNLSYVNRQKGSGTRILADYLTKKAGIDNSQIYGYEREEFTHTGVAAVIAAGAADVGLGIYSAARIYGLDFIPLYDEQYDLLINKAAWDLPSVQLFCEVLQGADLARRLEKMGGYTFSKPGQIRIEL